MTNSEGNYIRVSFMPYCNEEDLEVLAQAIHDIRGKLICWIRTKGIEALAAWGMEALSELLLEKARRLLSS